jgi:hypothetical protein
MPSHLPTAAAQASAAAVVAASAAAWAAAGSVAAAAAAVVDGGASEEAKMLRIFCLIAAAVACTLVSVPAAQAQQNFNSPEEAFNALVAATKTEDNRGLTQVLGRNGLDLLVSGDPVADRSQRQQFLSAYDARHEISRDGDKAYLVVGEDKFPLPVPLVQKGGSWRFDAVAARQEILFRRIGRNELDTIQTVLAYVDAQNDFADNNKSGKFNVYAERIISDPGKHNGLYWPAAAGEEQSPLGELFAEASGEGYHAGRGQAPYHGYYYKILRRQGPTAPGGAVDYIVRGQMIGGFALVAWPAEYGNSGVKTFVVNHEGVVFEKDLGPRTERIASRMTEFNPDHTWAKSQATTTASTGAQ